MVTTKKKAAQGTTPERHKKGFNVKHFTTQLFYQVAYLTMHGLQYQMKFNGKAISWTFPETEKALELSEKFYQDEHLQEYLSAFRKVRAVMVKAKQTREIPNE